MKYRKANFLPSLLLGCCLLPISASLVPSTTNLLVLSRRRRIDAAKGKGAAGTVHGYGQFHATPTKKAATISNQDADPIITTTTKTGVSPKVSSSISNSSNSLMAIISMSLLALQFGIQPGLVRKYTPTTICRSSVVLIQELLKVLVSAIIFWGPWTPSEERKVALEDWNWKTSLKLGGLPAALYCIQNVAALRAYQHLQPLTFNVLNQTKTLSAAFCCYLLMNKKQSYMQMTSLFLLLLAALIMEQVILLTPPFVASVGAASDWSSSHLTQGVLPILLASFLSGLAGALTQKNLQANKGGTKGRNPYLFTMELCSASAIFLLLSLLLNPSKPISSLFSSTGWTAYTWIPIVTNALGGILVGLVTKYAGVVRKGFALMFGILISGVCSSSGGVCSSQIMGGLLAAVSLYGHTKYPYQAATGKKETDSN